MTRIVIVIRWRNLQQRFTLCLPAKLSERCQQNPIGRNELRVFAPRSRRKRPVGPTRARGLLVCRTYGNFTRSWLMVG